jgi:hypothetical protein
VFQIFSLHSILTSYRIANKAFVHSTNTIRHIPAILYVTFIVFSRIKVGFLLLNSSSGCSSPNLNFSVAGVALHSPVKKD